ncbi:MAG TPA: MFS transporter [Candidatus Nanopelagicales bacterium]|nr:MFS transporter [Candidatus Nanopelagicales bacterium]
MGPTHVSTRTAPARTYASLRAAAVPLGALCLAFFVEMVDNTLMGIALPTIGRDLGGGTLSLQWVVAAYSVTFGGLLLTAGSAADRLGRRRVLLVGLAVFGVVSLGVLAVHSMGELIGLRALLGVAAAMMAPVTNSLVFRLFADDVLRRKAFTVMITVGMTGFILGPVLGGTLLTHVAWQWLLLINAPVALVAWIGVRAGVPADHPEDLTHDRLDLPAALLSVVAIGVGCYTFTSGVLHGWLSWQTIAAAAGALVALGLFVHHERRTREPMLDLGLLGRGTVRGALVAQLATAVAVAAVMFGLVLHFQYAYGWSPMKAGLANLPLILTMLAASPLAEDLVTRFGHRIACVIGSALLAGSLTGMALAVDHGYLAIVVFMVTFTIGLRIVMTTCAVALVDALPANRTSLATSLNDTAQEVGTSIGTAFIGTVIAVLVTTVLPDGAWGDELVSSYFQGERVTFLALAVIVGLVAGWGSLTLTDSHATEEH